MKYFPIIIVLITAYFKSKDRSLIRGLNNFYEDAIDSVENEIAIFGVLIILSLMLPYSMFSILKDLQLYIGLITIVCFFILLFCLLLIKKGLTKYFIKQKTILDKILNVYLFCALIIVVLNFNFSLIQDLEVPEYYFSFLVIKRFLELDLASITSILNSLIFNYAVFFILIFPVRAITKKINTKLDLKINLKNGKCIRNFKLLKKNDTFFVIQSLNNDEIKIIPIHEIKEITQSSNRHIEKSRRHKLP